MRLYRRGRHQGNQRTFLDRSLGRPTQGHKGSRIERVNFIISPQSGRILLLTAPCRIIRQSGLKINPFDGLDDAAERAVQLVTA